LTHPGSTTGADLSLRGLRGRPLLSQRNMRSHRSSWSRGRDGRSLRRARRACHPVEHGHAGFLRQRRGRSVIPAQPRTMASARSSSIAARISAAMRARPRVAPLEVQHGHIGGTDAGAARDKTVANPDHRTHLRRRHRSTTAAAVAGS
jgi:hypothetical protein